MSRSSAGKLPEILGKYETELLENWVEYQLEAASLRRDLITDRELHEQSRQFLDVFHEAVLKGNLEDILASEWAGVREFLEALSKSRAALGFSASETATFILSLKQPLFTRLRSVYNQDLEALIAEIWTATMLLDKLGLYATEVYQQTREELIKRQQEELLELSTPVVKLWDRILALPLIGTLDSARTQVVMENLLQMIVQTEASIAIIDITGVPAVDTLVAQHLLKTVAAARLMGADCIISGIRPQIAQTIVHLGVELSDITTKASLADAFAWALQRQHLSVVKRSPDA